MRKLLSLLGLVSVVACSSAPTIDPAMGGTWVGTSTVSVAGQAPATFAGQQVVVSVDGGMAQVAGICPSAAGSSGSGAVTATGVDDSAAWTASVSCPAVSIGSNPPAVITYTAGTTSCAMAMNSMNMDMMTLTNVSKGTIPAAGGGTSQVVVTFTGTMQ